LRSSFVGGLLASSLKGIEWDFWTITQALARLKGERIHASREEIAQSLEGTWRQELLFVLEQSLALYDLYQQKIADSATGHETNTETQSQRKSGQVGPAVA
jgi:hypothetical protein